MDASIAALQSFLGKHRGAPSLPCNGERRNPVRFTTEKGRHTDPNIIALESLTGKENHFLSELLKRNNILSGLLNANRLLGESLTVNSANPQGSFLD